MEGFGSINGSMPSQGAGFWLIREVALMRPCWGKPFLTAPTQITCWVLRVRNAVRVRSMLATLEQPLTRPLLQAAVLPLTVVIAIDVADCGRGCVCIVSPTRTNLGRRG